MVAVFARSFDPIDFLRSLSVAAFAPVVRALRRPPLHVARQAPSFGVVLTRNDTAQWSLGFPNTFTVQQRVIGDREHHESYVYIICTAVEGLASSWDYQLFFRLATHGAQTLFLFTRNVSLGDLTHLAVFRDKKPRKIHQDFVSIQSAGVKSTSAEQPHWPRANMSFNFSLGFCKRV